ncbi:unnamed protein product [Symbiodinium natans]|uniref:AB hydrolase-1 domain-containing protein n=1 Tax=Symbiodinium natans TaxID=878477 RepID=A0A812RA72_9DINO|nr:unnamed protein product [Symbiodinium natans]
MLRRLVRTAKDAKVNACGVVRHCSFAKPDKAPSKIWKCAEAYSSCMHRANIKEFVLDFRDEGGLRHRCLQWGSSASQGPLFFCLHAASLCGGVWAPVASRLASRLDCVVVACDLRGHGESDAPSGCPHYSWHAFGEDFIRLTTSVSKLYGRGPAACITHSFAGDTALIGLTAKPRTDMKLLMFDPVLADAEGAKIGAERLAKGTRRLGEKEEHGFDSQQAVGEGLERVLRAALARPSLHPEAKDAFAAFGSYNDSGRWRLLCRRDNEAEVYANRIALADFLSGKQVNAEASRVPSSVTDSKRTRLWLDACQALLCIQLMALDISLFWKIRTMLPKRFTVSSCHAELAASASCAKKEDCLIRTAPQTLFLQTCFAWLLAPFVVRQLWSGEAALRRTLATYGSTISACGSALQWQVSLQLLGQLQAAKLEPGQIVLNLCINSCRKAGQLHVALDIFKEMLNRSEEPDILCYTSLISACSPGAQWQLAICLHEEMRSKAGADVVSFNATLGVCREASRWQEANRIFSELCQANHLPTLPTFKAVIAAFAYAQYWSDALQHLQELRKLEGPSLSSDVIVQYGIVSKACAEAGRKDMEQKLLKEAQRLSVNVPSFASEWLSVLHWEAALAYFMHGQAVGAWVPNQTLGPTVAIADVLLDAGRHADAWNVLLSAQEAGVLRLWQDPSTLDLHQLGTCSPAVAVAAVSALLLSQASLHHFCAWKGLAIVTGQGIHSRHGVPILLPAVLPGPYAARTPVRGQRIMLATVENNMPSVTSAFHEKASSINGKEKAAKLDGKATGPLEHIFTSLHMSLNEFARSRFRYFRQFISPAKILSQLARRIEMSVLMPGSTEFVVVPFAENTRDLRYLAFHLHMVEKGSGHMRAEEPGEPCTIRHYHQRDVQTDLESCHLEKICLTYDVALAAVVLPTVCRHQSDWKIALTSSEVGYINFGCPTPCADKIYFGWAREFEFRSKFPLCAVLSGLFFIYAEGYRGFQQKFSPLVVRRALLLDGQQPVIRQVLAPAYAMAFFHAHKKRKVVSWGLIVGIMVIVAIVKKLPYPYRAILDAGVCAGLSWGMGATVFIYAKSLTTGKAPEIDPCLPQEP